MTYGDRLKKLRLDRNYKQSDIAAILDVSTSAVGSYERCERQPTFELLLKYAKLFNVSADYILCNSDETLTVEDYRQLDSFDLRSFFDDNSVTLAGIELSAEDKQRIIDIATVLIFDKLP